MILLLACADPELDPFARALASYEAGQEALAAGDPKAAAARFAEARAADPRSLPLVLWEARALAEATDLAGAEARLTEVLQADPTVGMAWYNRAAYRARAGRMDESASDLRRALELGVRGPLEAAADPDFAAARAHPAFAGLLPPQPLDATIRGPEGAVFVGSRVPIEIAVTTLPGAAPILRREGGDPGCLRLSRVVQDDRESAGAHTRTLTVELRAEGPCDAMLGPFTVSGANGASATLGAVPVKVEAPPGTPAVSGLPPLPAEWLVPSAFAAADAGFAAARAGGGVVAMGPAGRAVSAQGAEPEVRLEWRVDGQTRAVGGWWRSDGPVVLSADGWSAEVP